ncbi:UNVERIFIED_CONTAM: hypothetical protein GTU68_022109 [Idotea baltica]|nr:hypothetical protein [Idotea baltica]
MQRLWLTPSVRRFMRLGLPLLVLAGCLSIYFSNPDNRESLTLTFADIRASIEERPEFTVQLMAIDGASRDVADEIRTVLPIDFPLSSFDLDIEEMWKTVTALDAVQSAEVRIKPGGVLSVDVVERIPAIIWRSRRGLELLDDSGTFLALLDSRHAYPNLPLIAGQGGDKAVNEALNLIATSAPLSDRTLGLVRIGERRWDLLLDRDQRIMLPTQAPIPALERVIALSQAKGLLDRDLLAVDMRHPTRPTIRLNTTASEAFRQIRGDLIGGLNE